MQLSIVMFHFVTCALCRMWNISLARFLCNTYTYCACNICSNDYANISDFHSE